jgi:hypothetical protein
MKSPYEFGSMSETVKQLLHKYTYDELTTAQEKYVVYEETRLLIPEIRLLKEKGASYKTVIDELYSLWNNYELSDGARECLEVYTCILFPNINDTIEVQTAVEKLGTRKDMEKLIYDKLHEPGIPAEIISCVIGFPESYTHRLNILDDELELTFAGILDNELKLCAYYFSYYWDAIISSYRH